MANKVMTTCAVTILILQLISTAVPCDPRCKRGQAGTCQSNGRCLCWWGWTGPHATYITSGVDKNRILADYCSIACHYTQAIRNPLCAGTPTPQPQVCSVPKKTVPALPCDSLCGTGVYHSTGSCLLNGRCLCWWGWTGPNGCYVNRGLYKNRIIADRCDKACHYTRFYKNDKCTKKPTSLPPSTALPSTTAKPTEPATSVPCDPRCQGGQGTCQRNGRCFCWWGWTGPHAVYIMSGKNKNRILADYCTTACHYTHDYLNPACASIPTPKVCSVPANKTIPPLPCDPLCGTGTYHSAGQCLSNGRCLCWWGWTGPNACYVDGGTYDNRIMADRCDKACHYTHDHRNNNCTNNNTSTAKPSTQPVSTGTNPAATSVPCDPRCQGGQGTCQTNGRCFCWWGWTGPHAVYIMSGVNKNRILADYCTTACHYTHDYLNPACASIPTPKMCSVPANKTVPPLPCDPLCGTGTYHSAGQCLSNGRCLCWWGWTGPNACYVDGGTYDNRIIADRCDKACHYTHDHRNYNCTNNNTSTAKPSTQPVSTGNPGTGSRTTGKPTTAMSYQSSTNQPTTKIPTTTSPKTSSTTLKQTSTNLSTSVTSGQTTTMTPTTKKKTTTQGTTSTAKRTTTQAAPTTTQRTTTLGSTTTAAKPTTQGLATTGKTTTVGTTTSTMVQTTKQKTTTQGESSTTAKATTTQAVTTRAKSTTVGTTTGTMAPTTKQKTTTQAVTTTAKATTTQATTEPPEPTEPTEPPEPTEPTEPGVLQVRGMLPNDQHQLQNDVDDSEVDALSNEEENQEEKEPKKISTISLVIVLIVLLVCVTAFAGAVWWTYGNGSQCPSILRGYEPVAGSDANTLTDEFSTSTHVP